MKVKVFYKCQIGSHSIEKEVEVEDVKFDLVAIVNELVKVVLPGKEKGE
jgi:hypothetical protein